MTKNQRSITPNRARQRKRVLQLLKMHQELDLRRAAKYGIGVDTLITIGNLLKRERLAHWDSPMLRLGPKPLENRTETPEKWVN